MTKDQLLEKANSLPLAPGVYLMHDKNDEIIYVGKAKKLKNRRAAASSNFRLSAADSICSWSWAVTSRILPSRICTAKSIRRLYSSQLISDRQKPSHRPMWWFKQGGGGIGGIVRAAAAILREQIGAAPGGLYPHRDRGSGGLGAAFDGESEAPSS